MSGNAYTVTVERIGPDEARKLLEKLVPKYRRPNPRHVREFADMMKKGLWVSERDGPIHHDVDKGLVDGRRRLLAVVEANVAVDFQVVRGSFDDFVPQPPAASGGPEVCLECKGDPRGVLLLNEYVPCRTCATANASEFPETLECEGKLVRVPGKGVGKAIVYRLVQNIALTTPGVREVTRDFVEKRVLENGKHVFVHLRRQWWLEKVTTPSGKRENRTRNKRLLFCRVYDTEDLAMQSIGPEAVRN